MKVAVLKVGIRPGQFTLGYRDAQSYFKNPDKFNGVNLDKLFEVKGSQYKSGWVTYMRKTGIPVGES